VKDGWTEKDFNPDAQAQTPDEREREQAAAEQQTYEELLVKIGHYQIKSGQRSPPPRVLLDLQGSGKRRRSGRAGS
jgi:hypothetical protein